MTTKTIETLIDDINELLINGSGEVPDELYTRFGNLMADTMKKRLTPRPKEDKGTLRMSNIGRPCVRQTYLEINQPEAKEPLDGDTLTKFLIGDITEEVMLFLAEAAGHTVEGRQDVSEIAGILGHRDAVIDGTLVDVKSASPYSFTKFSEGKLKDSDPFGYMVQLQSYLHDGQKDPKVTDKSRAAFFVVEKVLGKKCLDFHDYEKWNLEQAYEERKEVINGPDLPDRGFEPEPDGYKHAKTKEFVPNGNEKLGINCAYCSVKNTCYPELRTFLSSKGPVFFSKIVKEPKMYEVV